MSAMTYSVKAAAAAAALAIGILAAPLAVLAQAQTPGPGGPVPSYAAASRDQAVRGIVANYDGKYVLQVRDRAGYLDNVRLHQGTIINPTGIPLQNGMRIVVYGYNAGQTFAANEIDVDAPPVVYAPGPPVHVGLRFGFRGRW
jgi:hypothetical protein